MPHLHNRTFNNKAMAWAWLGIRRWSRSDPWHCPPFAKLCFLFDPSRNFPAKVYVGCCAPGPPFFLSASPNKCINTAYKFETEFYTDIRLDTAPACNHIRLTPYFALVLKFSRSSLSNSTLSGSWQYDVRNAPRLGIRLGLLRSDHCSPEVSWVGCPRETHSPQLGTPCSTSRSRSSAVGFPGIRFSNPHPPS